MLGHRELTAQDYAGILKRRFWLILGSAVAFLGAGIGLTFVIPPQFESQTLVIVQQQRVPEDYVKPVINEDLNARLASMKEQILSRSRLEPIIERYNLFAGARNTMDDRVEVTRKAIVIKTIAPGTIGANKVPGFSITFKTDSARTAQQVCADITSLFVSENLNAREQSAEGTTNFLSQQVTEAKRKLDDQDAKLADFQRKYIGRLPGQEQTNLNTLQALTSRLDAATQALNRFQQDETFLSAMVNQQTGEVHRSDSLGDASADSPEKQLKDLRKQKQELEGLYTPDHPDVVAVSRRITDLEKQVTQTSANPEAKTTDAEIARPDSPQLQQIKAQLRAIRQSIAAEKQEQARIQQAVQIYQARIESRPAIEEEFKQVTRDHETALQFYNALLAKMNESTMATDLERRQEGEQFQVLDAANLPEEPSFPKPAVFGGSGFALGLLLGLSVAALLEYRDTSLRSEKDIVAFTHLPTLALISYIDGLPQVKPTRRLWSIFQRKSPAIPAENI
jgi:polysaccharide chain length determinant protein (PEP-CTERM system associated)